MLPSPTLALLDFLGGGEIMLVFVVVLIFFGGEKLPELARGIGKTMREFKKAANEVEQEFKRALDESDQKKAAAAAPVVSYPTAGSPPLPFSVNQTPPISIVPPVPKAPPAAPGGAAEPPAPPSAPDTDPRIDA